MLRIRLEDEAINIDLYPDRYAKNFAEHKLHAEEYTRK